MSGIISAAGLPADRNLVGSGPQAEEDEHGEHLIFDAAEHRGTRFAPLLCAKGD